LDKLRDGLAADRRLTGAFPTLGLFDDPALQKQANVMQAAHFSRTFATRLPPPSARRLRDKIRVGYFSADFHSHPMMHLMAELFEVHDKSRFEILAFSNGPDTDDPWRRRVRASFDAFHEIAAKSDREVVELARRLELDLAIDLSGFTGGCRPGVFLARAAPIQINYLGYPSTTALPTMDYLIADATVIPDDKRPFYTERVLWLPHCYQVNCQTREVAESPVTRADFGLPEEAFVFCSFNSQYKITPPMFDAWMRILAKVPDSVLWLLVKGDVARANIRRETEARGLDPARVVFADHLPVERHLQRIPLADLKLDSTPYGAHTTGSDCLRMGVPMVTLLGDAFAARVGASLLNAVGLPELITTDLAQYEALAVELATDALAAREDGTPTSRLSALRAKLEAHAKASPLFDTVATARALEGHFSEIVARYDEAHAAGSGDPDAR
jgi:predicted O-linked N-acetylglucosamine transferase (SPINDLY family)